jgi:hypothetical protein
LYGMYPIGINHAGINMIDFRSIGSIGLLVIAT